MALPPRQGRLSPDSERSGHRVQDVQEPPTPALGYGNELAPAVAVAVRHLFERQYYDRCFNTHRPSQPEWLFLCDDCGGRGTECEDGFLLCAPCLKRYRTVCGGAEMARRTQADREMAVQRTKSELKSRKAGFKPTKFEWVPHEKRIERAAKMGWPAPSKNRGVKRTQLEQAANYWVPPLKQETAHE